MTPDKSFFEKIGIPSSIKEGIKRDRKKRPLPYAMADRVRNEKITECLENEKIKRKDGIIDLRDIEDRPYLSPFTDSKFHKTGENEGFFTFTWFGFVMLIKNAKEITKDGKIDYRSEDAIYEIIGPDGKRIGDKEIKGYIEASEFFEEEEKNYRRKIEIDLGIPHEE